MTKRLSDKEKEKRSYIREWRKASPEGLGPYNIIWGSKDSHKTSHVKVGPNVRQIHIAKADTIDYPPTEAEPHGQTTSGVLAHEIAHSRTLKSQEPSWDTLEAPGTSEIIRDPHGKWFSILQQDPPGEKPYQDKVYVWREVAAVLYTLAKGWELERWVLMSELRDAAVYFGNGTLTDAKRVASTILKHQFKNNEITKEQSSRAIQEIDAVTGSEWREYKDKAPHIGGDGEEYHTRQHITLFEKGK